MCLLIGRYTEQQIATEDIVVYKHLCLSNNYKSTRFVTSYYHYPVIIGKTYKSKIHIVKDDFHENYQISEGIHSFTSIEDCCIDIDDVQQQVIAECIIPKGSAYYVGRFNNCESIASDTIKYEKLIGPL